MYSHRKNLLGFTQSELSAFAIDLGESRYRGAQLAQWLYAKGAVNFQTMTNLGKGFRERLEQAATIEGIELLTQQRSRTDGTRKFLFRLSDNLNIESVLIPPATAFSDTEASAEDEQRRLTQCVSTQVGCPLGCAFCATATMGFSRNLTTGEIIDQILQVRRLSGRKITNVVFMGMGEPMMNYENVMNAVDILTGSMGIAARRITVSTAGWADKIMRMGDEKRRVKLAVSLHSAVNETRIQLMPVNKRFGVSALLSALEYYYARVKQRVTYECVFFDGINDTEREVAQLIRFARRVPCKINVIPFHSINFVAPRGLSASLRASPRLEHIVNELRAHHLIVMVRSSAGEDIDAACGQLAARTGRLPHVRRTGSKRVHEPVM